MTVLECIQNEGSRELLAWKYPGRRLAVGSQLLVEPGEAAVLLLPNCSPRLFGPGRHTLQTPTLPLLDRLIRLPFGGKSPFQGQLWYLNTHSLLGLKWGTPTPVQLMDSRYRVLLSVRGYGRFDVRVEEPLLFFNSLCRNLSNAPADCRWFTDLLRGPITLQAKDVIAQYLAQNGGLACLGGSLLTISQQIEQRLSPVFAAYGVALLGFQLNDLSPAPENKNLERLQEAYTDRAAYRIRGGQDDNG